MRCTFLVLFSFLFIHKSYGQVKFTVTDSFTFDEIVITGFQTNYPKKTSLNIEAYSLKFLQEKSPFNLSDALAKIPGISQITTGNSISKTCYQRLVWKQNSDTSFRSAVRQSAVAGRTCNGNCRSRC